LAVQDRSPPGAEPGGLRLSHLKPALVALLLVAIALIGGELYARRVESRYIHALAPMKFSQKNLGRALQQEAFRQADLLPVYGGSEVWTVSNAKAGLTRYRATELFRTYPTGFMVFMVGKEMSTTLLNLQKLAAIGPELRGKKVVISLTWGEFRLDKVPLDAYSGNFSRLHAAELAFSTDLSPEFKQAVAKRLLDYRPTLENDPVLEFALERLAGGGLINSALYYAVLPLGKLQNLVLRLQDHWETIAFIHEQHYLRPASPRYAAALDWRKMLLQAEGEYRQVSNNNRFGFDNERWRQKGNEWNEGKGTNNDATFLRQLKLSKEWVDLDLLLRLTKELGAQPLILSAPMCGAYLDYSGVSTSARSVYYEKLREATKPYGVPVLDFEYHDGDKCFILDYGSHLSPKGWVYYDRALDAFYHRTLSLPELADLSRDDLATASQQGLATVNKELKYQQLIKRVREVAQTVVPAKAVVIVVSDGDEDLLKLGDREGWHFPQIDNGMYAGHRPADSAEAIAHLEALRSKGGSFMLFPNTTFWWLDYYAEFRKHLESHYRVVARHEDSCLIFDLRQQETTQRER
jgi:D-alanine transfer protein